MPMKTQALRDLTAVKYEGGNEYIDHLVTGESWFMIQGLAGRRPVQADTKQEAIDFYVRQYCWIEDGEEEDEEEVLVDCG